MIQCICSKLKRGMVNVKLVGMKLVGMKLEGMESEDLELKDIKSKDKELKDSESDKISGGSSAVGVIGSLAAGAVSVGVISSGKCLSDHSFGVADKVGTFLITLGSLGLAASVCTGLVCIPNNVGKKPVAKGQLTVTDKKVK